MSEEQKYELWYRIEGGTIHEFPLTDEITIGRDPGCNLAIPDEDFSPQHVRINQKPDGIWITHLGTASITLLNDQPMLQDTPLQLILQQTFHIGHYTFTLMEEEATPPVISGVSYIKSDSEQSSVGSPLGRSNELEEEPALPAWMSKFLQLGKGKIIFIGLAAVIVIAISSFGIIFTASKRGTVPFVKATPTSPISQVTPSPILTPEPTRSFELSPFPTSSLSAANLTLTPPGLGEIHFSPFSISIEQLGLVNLVNLQLTLEKLLKFGTMITGKNIAYVYRYAGINLNDQTQTVEKVFVGAEVNKETGGVTYPEWGENIPVQLEWKPVVFTIFDGEKNELALLRPIDYGNFYKDAQYSIRGNYVSKDDGAKTLANLYFDKNGKLTNIMGFSKNAQGQLGSPHEITAKKGDEFIILLERIEVVEKIQDLSGEIGNSDISTLAVDILGDKAQVPITVGKVKFVEYEGGTLTFGDIPFTWKTNTSTTGQYVIGIVIEDLDGNFFAAYFPIEVIK